ncbi:hypothetical protein GR170_18005 [Pseudooceanicola sp. GBMRC 2024]|uniref:Uncharacterized protein n=1 Tax=Pseudooceanicola albus TaxID=2692189 RepID=A0A6L7G6N7_9RHOB|nr:MULTISPECIES: hypothetical protein [Pseudooceanicola]MXN19731.1 hypothetical protein [Pseudooceanicola albus]
MRRSMIEIALAMTAYVVVLVLSLLLLARGGIGHPGGRIAVSLLPVLPALGIFWVTLRDLARLDEMQRRIALEALALAYGATALLTFSYGLLENVGFPRLSMFAVWPVMGALWVLGKIIAQWRYR